MTIEQSHTRLTPEEKQRFQEAGLVSFAFPSIDLREEILPGAEKEILWLRRHVDEGSASENALISQARVVYVDTTPCPLYLNPYQDVPRGIDTILIQGRSEGRIADEVHFGSDEIIVPDKGARWGISIDEIDSFVIPRVASMLGTKRKIRLPTAAELLYLRLFAGIFDDNQDIEYAKKTREWTGDGFCEWTRNESFDAKKTNKPLGNIFVSGDVENLTSGGIHWWLREGKFNRLPSLAFRLVFEIS